MLLSCRILTDVVSVNSFEFDTAAKIAKGDATPVYLQLIDASVNTLDKGFYPSGRRFVPSAGATLQITFDNINDAKKIARFATQPFATDGSIWQVSLLSTDQIDGTVNIKLSLNQGGVITSGFLEAGLLIY